MTERDMIVSNRGGFACLSGKTRNEKTKGSSQLRKPSARARFQCVSSIGFKLTEGVTVRLMVFANLSRADCKSAAGCNPALHLKKTIPAAGRLGGNRRARPRRRLPPPSLNPAAARSEYPG